MTFSALGGAVALFLLFFVDLLGIPIDFMGFSADARAKGIIFGRYGAHIVTEQIKIAAAYLILGAAFGLATSWMRPPAETTRKRKFFDGAVGALCVHVFVLTVSLRNTPQLYSELLYDHGGLPKQLMLWMSGRLSSLVILGVSLGVLSLRFRRLDRRTGTLMVAFVAASTVAWYGATRSQGSAGPRASTASLDRPNVLLLAVDSLRADRVFGADRARFPHLAALADRSTRFRQAHVTVPRTFPSWTTLLTGRYPHHHGIRHMFPTAAERAAIGPTLPAALAKSGYRTAVVSDYAGEIFSRTPYGFQDVDAPRFDMRSIVDQRSLQVHPNLLPYATTRYGERLFPVVQLLPERTDPELLADRALGRLSKLSASRFFLTVFFSTAHFPYASPAPYYSRFADPSYDGPFRYQKPPLSTIPVEDRDARQINALYDGAISAVDHAIGRILDDLARSGRDRDTIIVLLADHGENLYDVPGRGMGHGDHLLGDAADHIPLLIYDPRTPTSRNVDEVVRDVDLSPTIAARLGIAAPPTDGIDLSALMRGERKDLDLPAFTETEFWFTPSGPGFSPTERLPYPDITGVTDLDLDDDIYLKPEWKRSIVAAKHRALRRGSLKLLYRPTRAGVSFALYDLARDPRQTVDVSSQHPVEFAALKEELLGWISQDPGSVRVEDFVLPTQAPPAIAPANPASNNSSPLHAVSLVRLAGSARVDGPSLSSAWARLDFPERIVSPYSGLRGEDAYRVVIPTFATEWGKTRTKSQADPVWNRYRGSYRAVRSLFLPQGSTYRFAPLPMQRGKLIAKIAVAPRHAPSDLEVRCGTSVIHRATIDSTRQPAPWTTLELPIDCAEAVSFAHRSDDSRAALFLGDPRIIPTTPEPSPNLLFIVIDTLRADVLPLLPHLSSWAKQSVTFTQAITAATWTRPSLLAMFGGDLPSALGQSAETMIPTDADRRRFYQLSPPLLPRVLDATGYQTTAIGNNFFLLGHPRIGLDFGFQQVSDLRHPQLDTPAIANEAIDFIKAARDPWFLYLHFDGPHWPYSAPAHYRPSAEALATLPKDDATRSYLAEALYTDDHVARVLDALAQHPAAKNTVVVVVGDHGEIFDHAHAHSVHALGFPTLHHHGWSAYDEVTHVPLVISAPGVNPREVKTPVSLIDLDPTLRELLAVPQRPSARGASLVSAMRGEPMAARPIFIEGQNVRALRDGSWVYLRRTDGRLTTLDGKQIQRTEELYDLSTDPLEHRDLAPTHEADLARLRAAFDRATPHLPEGALAKFHLRGGTALGARHLTGTITSPGLVRAITVDLNASARLDFTIDPPDAAITFALTIDGHPLSARDLRVGEFGLPILADTHDLSPSQLSRLDTSLAPPPGTTDLVLLWRDPSSTTTALGESSAESNEEVAGMMQRWGYSQPEEK